jgi:hypothetical protein
MPRAEKPVAYYTFQHRLVMQSAHLDPDGPMKKVKKEKWSFSSFDAFWLKGPCDRAVQPGLKLPRYGNEAHECWEKTGSHGYLKLSTARKALKYARKADEAGDHDYHDGYRKRYRACRYEFRLVKVIWVPDTVVVVE